jgi:hypothetical protein
MFSWEYDEGVKLNFDLSIKIDNKPKQQFYSSDNFPISLYRDNLSINSSAFFIGLNWYTKSDDFRSERQSSYLLPNEFYRLIFDLERAYNGQSKFKYDPETKKLLEPKGIYFASTYKAFTLKCILKTQSIENNLYPWGIELFSEIYVQSSPNTPTSSITQWAMDMSFQQVYMNILMMKSIDLRNLANNSLILNYLYGNIKHGRTTEEVKHAFSMPTEVNPLNVNLQSNVRKESPFGGKKDNKTTSTMSISSSLDSFEKFK